MDFEDLVK